MYFASDSRNLASLIQENNQKSLLRSLWGFRRTGCQISGPPLEEGFQGREALGGEVVAAVAGEAKADQFPELFTLKVGHKGTASSMLHYSRQRLGAGAPS